MTDFLAVGWDMALNHAAVVVLDGQNGEMVLECCVVTRKKDTLRKVRQRIPPEITSKAKTPDRQQRLLRRAWWMRGWVDEVAKQLIEYPLASDQTFVALEDYAHNARQGAHYMGELGWVVRETCLSSGFPLRLVAPTLLKFWATGKGAHPGEDTKKEVARGVFERWAVSFEDHPVADDMVDAYALAQLVRAEVLIRRGDLDLRHLYDDAQRQTFLRASKNGPNILGLEWGTL